MEPYRAGKQQIDMLVRIKEVYWKVSTVIIQIKIDLI